MMSWVVAGVAIMIRNCCESMAERRFIALYNGCSNNEKGDQNDDKLHLVIQMNNLLDRNNSKLISEALNFIIYIQKIILKGDSLRKSDKSGSKTLDSADFFVKLHRHRALHKQF
jgi:hypothetical protein